MKIIIYIVFFIFVFICACSDKKNTAGVEFGRVALSISSASINFIDFPLTVDSITLIRANGDSHQLTTGFSVNLANFGENPQYISMDTKVPVGVYSRIMINLAFDKDSTVTYFDTLNSEKPVTQHLVSPTGKKLGIDNTNFVISMPFFTSKFEVQPSRSTHLNVAWNLNASTDIFKSSGGEWIVEFKPLVNADAIKKTTAVDVTGIYIEEKNRVISLQSIFDLSKKGLIEINLKSSAKFLSDGKLLPKNQLDNFPLGGHVYVSGEMAIDSDQLIIDANKVVYYDDNKTVIKGLVVDKEENTFTVFGGNISASDYLMRPNIIYKVPSSTVAGKQRLYGIFSKIKIQLMVDQVESLLHGRLYQGSEVQVVLSGQVEEVSLNESVSVEDSEDESDYDVFYFTLTDNATDSDAIITDGNDKTVTVESVNGLAASGDFVVVFRSTEIEVDWNAGQFWRGKGVMVFDADNNVLLLDTIEEVNPESLSTYSYDFKLDQLTNSGSSVEVAQSGVNIAALEESQGDENLSDRLIFTRPLNLQSVNSGAITCKSISMNLQSNNDAYKEDAAVAVFELIQNEEEWAKMPTSFEALNKDFDGDKSSVDILYSRKQLLEWFQGLMDVSGAKLLIHSLRIVNKYEVDIKISEEDGHCSLVPQNISIRWVREGTRIVDNLNVDNLNADPGKKNDTWVSAGAITGIVIGGLVALDALYLFVRRAYRIFWEPKSSVTSAAMLNREVDKLVFGDGPLRRGSNFKPQKFQPQPKSQSFSRKSSRR